MAKKEKVVLVDDLTGGPADETIRFGLDDQGYVIDLNMVNAAALRSVIRSWAEKARIAAVREKPVIIKTGTCRLKPEQQKAIWLGYAKGLSVQEIARKGRHDRKSVVRLLES